MWVALMNLENLYGTQESLVKVFERALQQNEPKKVFFQLIGIYTRTDKLEVRITQKYSNHLEAAFSYKRRFARYYLSARFGADLIGK